MAITKIQSESLNLADDYSFTGTITGAGESNVPAFMAYRSGTQTLSSGVTTKVQYNAELFDTANCYDSTTNYRFTPNVAGKYYIFHNAGYGRDTSNVSYGGYLTIHKNGVQTAYQQFSTTSDTNYLTQVVTTVLDMNGSSDYVEAFINHGVSSGTPSVGSGISINQFGGFLITT